MINQPQTLAEARRHQYGIGLHGRRAYVEGRCAFEVWPNERAPMPHQCLRSNGHGPDKLYCRQHDPVAIRERTEKSEARYRRKLDAAMQPWRERDLYARALRAIVRAVTATPDRLRAMAADALAKAKAP